jgi:uncharacterized small protein (DUF1192 family)
MENSQQLAQQLADYDSKRKSSADVLNEAMGKYGIPEIRSRVAGLRTTLTNTENALNAVDPSVTGRTQGSLVTEAQRQKQVANERAPIAEQYGSLSRSLGDAQSNLSDQERAAQMLAEGQLNDYSAGREALSTRYNLALGRETEDRRRLEADRAFQLEQQRAADARRAAAASIATPTLGKTTATPAQQQSGLSDSDKQRAFQKVQELLSLKDNGRIMETYQAIKKSAAKGNLYDQAKLELLNRAGVFDNQRLQF